MSKDEEGWDKNEMSEDEESEQVLGRLESASHRQNKHTKTELF